MDSDNTCTLSLTYQPLQPVMQLPSQWLCLKQVGPVTHCLVLDVCDVQCVYAYTYVYQYVLHIGIPVVLSYIYTHPNRWEYIH